MHSDLRGILTALQITAEENLKRQDGFTPFGYILFEGQVIQGIKLEKPIDGARKDFEYLRSQLIEKARTSDFVAIGLGSMAQLKPKPGVPNSKALYAMLEHSTGECVTAFLPFSKTADGYIFDQEILRRAEPVFFKHKQSG